MREIVLVLFFLATAVVRGWETEMRIRNRSRQAHEIRTGDVVELTCLPCELGITNVTEWKVYGIDTVLLRTSGTAAMVKFMGSGNAIIEATTSFGGNCLTSVLVKRTSSLCYQWKSCFKESKSNNSPCLTSWDNYTLSNAEMFLYIWLSEIGTNEWSTNTTSDRTEAEKQITAESQILGERPKAQLIQHTFMEAEDQLVLIEDADGLATYHADERLWSVSLRSLFSVQSIAYFAGGTIGIQIDGQSVNVMGCSAGKEIFYLDLNKYNMEPASEATRESQTLALDSWKKETCSSVVIVPAKNTRYFFATQNSIGQSVKKSEVSGERLDIFDPFSQIDSSIVVNDFALMRGAAILLGSDGNLYLYRSLLEKDLASSKVAVFNRPVPTGVNRLGYPSSCDFLLDFYNRTRSDLVAAWRGGSTEERSFYVTSKESQVFTEYIFAETTSSKYEIYTVVPLVSIPEILVMVKDMTSGTEKLFMVHQKNIHSKMVAEFGLGSKFPALGPNVKIVSPAIPSGEVIMYGNGNVYYSPTMGQTWKAMEIRHFSIEKAAYVTVKLSAEDSIREIVTSWKGDVAILTVNGRIFKGKVGLLAAYEVYSPLAVGTEDFTTLVYRPDSTLLALQGKNGSPDLSMHEVLSQFRIVSDGSVDLASIASDSSAWEKLWSIFDQPFVCPYLVWSKSTPQDNTQYLDMNDYIEAELVLVHDSKQDGMFVSYQISNRNLVDMAPGGEVVGTNADGSILTRTRAVNISVPSKISSSTGIGKQDEATGSVILRSTPAKFSFGCDHYEQLLHINVGCPRGRHLRYKPPDKYLFPSTSVVTSECDARAGTLTGLERQYVISNCTCERYENIELSVLKTTITRSILDIFYQSIGVSNYVKYLDDGNEDSATYTYDIGQFGCPTYVPYTDQFKPQLEIWDGDTFVKQVEADFTLLEVHGRTEVSFGSTAADVGCMRKPMTWSEKLSTNSDFFTAWGPNNHESCFNSSDATDSSTWASLQYEILNVSSSNYIAFSKDSQEVPFQFFITVVDPDYSFCTLQTMFSVEPYGMPMDSWTTFLIIVYVVLSSLGLLGCTYLVHRRDILNAANAADTKKTN